MKDRKLTQKRRDISVRSKADIIKERDISSSINNEVPIRHIVWGNEIGSKILIDIADERPAFVIED